MEENSNELTTVVKEIQEALIAEKNELEELDKTYILTPKFIRFVALFTDKYNKMGLNTFGNATQSVLHAYNLNPETQYNTALVMGTRNFAKLKAIGSKYLETQGITFGRLMDIAITKMVKTNDKVWFDQVASWADMPGIIRKGETPQALTQNNINVYNINDPEVEKFNAQFLDFIERGTTNKS